MATEQLEISSQTSDILKNFATINRSLKFNVGTEGEGTFLSTVSPSKNIFGQATVPEVFPKEWCAYDLGEFLRLQGFFENPAFDFGDNSVTITETDKRGTFAYTDEQNITFPSKPIKFPGADWDFTLDADAFANIINAASVLQRPYIGFVSGDDGKSIEITAFDVRCRSPTPCNKPAYPHPLTKTGQSSCWKC